MKIPKAVQMKIALDKLREVVFNADSYETKEKLVAELIRVVNRTDFI